MGRQTKVTYLDAQNHELQMELVVRRLKRGGLGAQAGLAPGDHILSYNGQAVASDKQFADLTTSGVYPFRTVTVRRGAKIITLEVERGGLGVNLGLVRVDAEKESGDPAPVPAAASR